MKRSLKIVLGVIAIVAITYNITLYYVDYHMKQRINQKKSYHECHKIWSARGIYANKEEQNSIKSFSKAMKVGYKGLEVDFYYDTFLDKFIVSHDKPTKDKQGELHYNLKNSKLLTLQELFESLGENGYFWLDYKNLDRLNKEDTLKAIQRLEEITKIYHIKERIYLEGCNPFSLSLYENAGFKTLLSFHPLPEDSPFTSISSNFFKMIYYFSNTTALAMQYGKVDNPKYNKITERNLKGIPQFIFHVPTDKELIQNLIQKKDIKVLLIGKDQSVNFSYFDSCTN